MAASDVLKHKIGLELLEWVYLGTRTGMRRGVAEYRQRAAAGDTLNAERAIKRAVDLPHRVRARVQQGVTTYGLARIDEVIAAALPTVTRAQINTDLAALETYADGLVTHRNVDGWTWDQIATDIETNITYEGKEWEFPLPAGYLDVWGE